MRKIMDNKAVSPVVGTILLIAITVALAAIVATLVSGLGGRGAPPSVMLTVTAKNTAITDSTLVVTLSHNGGDDLQLKDLTVKAINSNGSVILDNSALDVGVSSGTFSVGSTDTVKFTTATTSNNFNSGNIVTVYVIHNPSKQKLFSSSTILVASA
jgi:flagellin-like protein